MPVILSPYRCTGWNRRTRRDCTAVVIDAWSATGAVVRRRCGDCGTWQVIQVEGTGPIAEPVAEPPLARMLH